MQADTPFTEFSLNTNLISSLSGIGFENASEIQEMTINPILEGKDVLALAETGSGKTGSFVIPIIEQILRDTDKYLDGKVHYVTLSPTRELAQQTHKVFNEIGKELGIKAACLIGGENFEKQEKALSDNPSVVVATPGRLVDFIKQKKVDLREVSGVVFDEADRLFDMGFKDDIEFILRKVKKERQLIMVSATTNQDVLRTCYKFKSEPVELKLNEDSLLVDNINHSLAMLSGDEKMPFLVNTLRNEEDTYAIVFCNTQFQTHLVAEWLRKMGFKAKPISGRLSQNKRTRLMQEFRNKEVTILVCTDVAARGLDIKDVTLVINYDIPQEAANYVHRIGRTGRAGKSGRAISLCAHEDCEHLDPIYELIDAKIDKLPLTDDDFANDLCEKPYIDYKTLRLSDEKSKNSKKDSRRDNKKTDKRDRNPKSSKSSENKKEKKMQRETQTSSFLESLETPERTPMKPFVKTESEKPDSRIFEYTHESESMAKHAALGYFQINDEELLNVEVIEKGKKKFIFFGPSKNKFKITIKPIYKKVLTPFLNEIIKLSHLKIEANVGFKNNTVLVNFSGEDMGLLMRNRADLFNSFETLIKIYVAKKVFLPRDIRFNIEADSKNAKREGSRDNKRSRNDNRGNRNDNRGNRRNDRNGNRGNRRNTRTEIDEDRIIVMVDQIKEQVISTGQPQMLKSLNPAERRIVHQYVSEDGQLETKSIGEGKFKKIELSLKQM